MSHEWDDADRLEAAFLEAVLRGDADGVDASLRLMAAVDPRRADRLFRYLKLSLRLAQFL